MTRRVLVTGSSRGIGRAIALRLAQDGFAVTVHCREQIAPGEATVAQIREAGGTATLVSFDVRHRDTCRQVLDADVAEHGAYYGIVCGAGITRDNAFPALSDDDWDSVIDTSLDGFFNVVHPLTMPMVRLRAGGRIVTVASVSGVMGNRGQVNYSAAKAGVIGLTKALGKELAHTGVRVTCVAPGVIETDVFQKLSAEYIHGMLAKSPVGRFGRADEVAAMVAWLCSDESDFCTGAVFDLSGGRASY